MEEAQQVKTRKVISEFGSMMDTLTKNAPKVEEGAVREAKVTDYDADTVISYALVAWSYDAECDKEHKELLDGRTRDWLHNLIVARNTYTGPLGKNL